MAAFSPDPNHTQVEFAAKHFGMMTVRGHFQEVATTGTIDPAKPENSSFEVTINVASVEKCHCLFMPHLSNVVCGQ